MTSAKPAAIIFLCALTAQAATAQVANGRFQLEACTTEPQDTVVDLENNVLTFHESVCTLANPVAIEGTAGYSYIANCEGEGETWTANMVLVPLEDGAVMRMIRDGIVLDYARCAP